jgi:hypothetical protein
MRNYKGWQILTCGGHITMKRFEGFKDGRLLWRFKLRELKALIDQIESGDQVYDQLPELYRKPLYI